MLQLDWQMDRMNVISIYNFTYTSCSKLVSGLGEPGAENYGKQVPPHDLLLPHTGRPNTLSLVVLRVEANVGPTPLALDRERLGPGVLLTTCARKHTCPTEFQALIRRNTPNQ